MELASISVVNQSTLSSAAMRNTKRAVDRLQEFHYFHGEWEPQFVADDKIPLNDLRLYLANVHGMKSKLPEFQKFISNKIQKRLSIFCIGDDVARFRYF